MIVCGKNTIKTRVVLFNIAIWIALFIIISLPFSPSLSFSLLAPLILPVYLHLFFLEKFYSRKKYFCYAGLTLLTIIIFGVIAEELANHLGLRTRIRYIDEAFNPIELRYSISTFFIYAGFNPALAIIVTTVVRYFRQRQLFNLQQLQEQKTRAELDLLKNQVNPHFFFNTLNTLFSMASVKEDDETAAGIAQLSELMRYMLYDAKVDFIKLEKEVDHIHNYINLQKLRFSQGDTLEIDMKITGDIKPFTIQPMLLIPFIENAFKHGLSVKDKNIIKIDLMVFDNYLNFKVYNTRNTTKKKTNDEHSGIGIDNVRKRLELLYPDSHTLIINESEHHYEIYLKLPLNRK